MVQIFFPESIEKLANLKEASIWASQYIGRVVTVSNLSYLLQYGRIRKYGNNGNSLISIEELKKYYDSFEKEKDWKRKFGEDINGHLSFVEYTESERTKHVHRLHPYKGKFIPQLVEYFLDSHTDEFKSEIYFHEGEIVLDPFCGSGTTLVQANELNMHAIGIDISAFNALICNIKVEKHNFQSIEEEIARITFCLKDFLKKKKHVLFEEALLQELNRFNSQYFPSPEYKWKISHHEIDENEYSKDKENEFLNIYNNLVHQFQLNISQEKNDTFLSKWFLLPVREEIDFVFDEIKKIGEKKVKKVIALILSRTVRSCRATTHADLGTLKDSVKSTYYCKKHGKICKPIFSILNWWITYATDTVKRLKEFEGIRTETHQICLIGDSRSIDICEELKKKNQSFYEIFSNKGIQGIFSSPPYVGLIDYHEQHAYAYELFGFARKDELEIGSMVHGQGKVARDSYIKGISQVLINCKKHFLIDYNVFLVANDKYNLYPTIAELAGMKIVSRFRRPVLNRVEKDRETAYSETIFHLNEK